MAVHHIFSRKHYPHLSTSIDNLITLTEETHRKFHQWNGGSNKACTVDDLICFVNEQYPEKEDASVKLHQIKKMLGEQKRA